MAILPKTSGELLLDLLADRRGDDADAAKRYALATDVYNKQHSYAWLNKVCWILAIPLSLAVLIWPLIVIRANVPLAEASAAQTVTTALWGFAVYFYGFYKKRQLATENLLRRITFSDELLAVLVSAVIDEMTRIDQGFGFTLGSKPVKEDR